MLVVIDESGDTGFKNGSSRYFVMTMVVFQPLESGGRCEKAEHTAGIIKAAMKAAKHVPEYHFTQCSHTVRNHFFNALNAEECDFCVYSLVVDKELITSPHLRKSPKDFYNFVLKQLLSHNPIQGARVKVDGSARKDFKKALTSYLRQGQDGMVHSLKFVDSKKDVLIQLADMACGAIAKEYRMRLGKRIKNIWKFQ
jgi:Protein of unknown function (DUF3800)